MLEDVDDGPKCWLCGRTPARANKGNEPTPIDLTTSRRMVAGRRATLRFAATVETFTRAELREATGIGNQCAESVLRNLARNGKIILVTAYRSRGHGAVYALNRSE